MEYNIYIWNNIYIIRCMNNTSLKLEKILILIDN